VQVDAVHVLVAAAAVRVAVVVALAARLAALAAAAAAAAVSVRVRHVVEEDEADDVHEQAQHRDGQQVLAVDLGRLPEALERLGHDADADEDEEHGVHEAREHLVARVAVGEDGVAAPARHVAGVEPDEQARVVEEHVACAGSGGRAGGRGDRSGARSSPQRRERARMHARTRPRQKAGQASS
jgi:hypothetical protein